MMPLAAAFLIAAGVIRYERRPQPLVATVAPTQQASLLGDEDLRELNAVPAARRVAFETGIRNVNSYIRDAEESGVITEARRLYLKRLEQIAKKTESSGLL